MCKIGSPGREQSIFETQVFRENARLFNVSPQCFITPPRAYNGETVVRVNARKKAFRRKPI